jgi:hypothetical protein
VQGIFECFKCGGTATQVVTLCTGCASSIKESLPTATNSAMDAIAALQSSLHANYQPCHQFSRDEVITMLRQLHQ